MELFELVREIESAPDASAPARIARSRERLIGAIADTGKRRRRTRWVWGGTAAAGGLSVATIATTVIIAGTVAPVVAQPASAAAVAVLSEAADLVLTGVDPVVGPGQYLKVRETYELVSLWDADASSPSPVSGFNMAALPTSEGAIYTRGIRDLYVPSDRSDDWILDDRFTNEVLDVWGDPDALDAYNRLVADMPERDADPGGIEALPGGLQKGMADTTDDDRFYDPLRDSYSEMPRDPQQLLAWYREHLETSSEDWYIFQAIGRYLSTDVMPADLRAASLRVLGLLGGVDVARTNGTITTLAMPADVGEGGEFGDLLVSELDIDTSSGRIVGSRETYPHRATDLMPAGVPWASTTIEVTVVDEAPEP
ncbi:MAG: hypothetical protein ACTHNQ_19435 [Microbacterium sp.]|uniref:hypothetical protein n=1 Tax=Microbacterium sp. TaxID=51671 RepID=UPI003F81E329